MFNTGMDIQDLVDRFFEEEYIKEYQCGTKGCNRQDAYSYKKLRKPLPRTICVYLQRTSWNGRERVQIDNMIDFHDVLTIKSRFCSEEKEFPQNLMTDNCLARESVKCISPRNTDGYVKDIDNKYLPERSVPTDNRTEGPMENANPPINDSESQKNPGMKSTIEKSSSKNISFPSNDFDLLQYIATESDVTDPELSGVTGTENGGENTEIKSKTGFPSSDFDLFQYIATENDAGISSGNRDPQNIAIESPQDIRTNENSTKRLSGKPNSVKNVDGLLQPLEADGFERISPGHGDILGNDCQLLGDTMSGICRPVHIGNVDSFNEETSEDFNLTSVIVHFGLMGDGFYVCYRRMNDRWFLTYDLDVKEVSKHDVFYSKASILFYEKP